MLMVEGRVGRTELKGQEAYLNFVDFTYFSGLFL